MVGAPHRAGEGASGEPMLRLSAVLASLSVLVTVLALAGWMLDEPLLSAWLDGRSTMKVNTVLALLALALAVWRHGTLAGRTAAASAGVLAALVGSQYVTGVDLGIDELWAQDPQPAHGRMAPTTVVAIVGLAVALLPRLRGRNHLVRSLAAVPIFIGALALMGYLFAADHLYGGIVPHAEIALPTALALVLLSLALLVRVPDSAVPWVLRGGDLGAVAARHVLPVALGVIPAVGILSLVGMRLGWFDAAFGVAIMVCVDAGVVIAVAVRGMRRLRAVDLARSRAIEDLEALTDSLRDGRDSEWRRAEELRVDLEHEREKFEAAVSQMDDLVWTWRVDSLGEPHLVFASSDASGIFGGALEGLGDAPLLAVAGLVHEDDRAEGKAFLGRVLSGQADQVTVRLVGLDGETRWIWVRARCRRSGEELYVDGICSNVTERQLTIRKQEQLLRLEQEHVRRLEDFNALRSRFLEVTGHELRTPLTTLRGYTELLYEDAGLTTRQRGLVEVLRRRAAQMAELVDGLGDLAKVDAGHLKVEPRDVDLADIVQQSVAAYRQAAAAADTAIDMEVSSMQVHADPGRLRQVLDNLLSNAIKYGGPGTITVRTTQVQDTAVLTVTDHGPGISDAELPRIFEQMYRAERADFEGIPGSGLGLATCKALVEAHGGSVTASNLAGGGAVFTVRLPVVAPVPEPPGEPVGDVVVADPAGHRGPAIQIVD